MIQIVKKNIKLIIIKLVPIITFIIIGFYISVFDIKFSNKTFSNLYFSIPIIVSILAIFGMIYTSFFFSTSIIIGDIVFKSDHIIIFKEKIFLKNINSIQVKYRSFYGQATGSLTIAKGDDNKIDIKCKNGKIYKHTFLLTTNWDLSYLKKWIEYYKKNYKEIDLIWITD